ncbi:MarR family transcriptional regulator [Parabacteroides sp. AF17-28]|uniref:MarR family winged helix-turn-helix transcriptional regulator n=1 Tax=Parabacteroides sp. AF17-28 TaxID=2292241 RepID=UPI000EFF403E|nr:MarR family transcriptional regulator [Parabacteroides sp. AF17-28]RHR56659.1 MarR family transcriptional regulator [Parabacteroides sp. AF17-28]
MVENEAAHELVLQILKTRMTFRQTIQRVLKSNNVDMTFEMLQVMHRLWKKPGVSQQYLAEQTAKDKACLTNLINNLEKKGWVERREDPSDRRNKQIHLTEAGEELSHRVKPLLHNIYDEVGARLTTRQIESFMNNLKKLDEILDKI